MRTVPLWPCTTCPDARRTRWCGFVAASTRPVARASSVFWCCVSRAVPCSVWWPSTIRPCPSRWSSFRGVCRARALWTCALGLFRWRRRSKLAPSRRWNSTLPSSIWFRRPRPSCRCR
uniref:(northern house mosquito) hypothetical protein n=1 Tax=Culex pipiens TaxID=7175 RepID=A0A8D8NK44_CULPI